jgi:hypothetical protein
MAFGADLPPSAAMADYGNMQTMKTDDPELRRERPELRG